MKKLYKFIFRKCWVNVEPDGALAFELDFKGYDYESE